MYGVREEFFFKKRGTDVFIHSIMINYIVYNCISFLLLWARHIQNDS